MFQKTLLGNFMPQNDDTIHQTAPLYLTNIAHEENPEIHKSLSDFLKHLELLWKRVTNHPENPLHEIYGYANLRKSLIPWFQTQETEKYGREKQLLEIFPAAKLIHQVHDKAFALKFTQSHVLESQDPLSHMAKIVDVEHCQSKKLLQTTVSKHIEKWPNWAQTSFTLKPRIGTSGRGRLQGQAGRIIFPKKLDFDILRAETSGFILEPWIKRDSDFSTQFVIGPDDSIRVYAIQDLINTRGGIYRGNAGHTINGSIQSIHDWPRVPPNSLRIKFLQTLRSLGYKGPGGIDSFTYHLQDNPKQLYQRDVVELNARFTVGYIAANLANQTLGKTPTKPFWLFLLNFTTNIAKKLTHYQDHVECCPFQTDFGKSVLVTSENRDIITTMMRFATESK